MFTNPPRHYVASAWGRTGGERGTALSAARRGSGDAPSLKSSMPPSTSAGRGIDWPSARTFQHHCCRGARLHTRTRIGKAPTKQQRPSDGENHPTAWWAPGTDYISYRAGVTAAAMIPGASRLTFQQVAHGLALHWLAAGERRWGTGWCAPLPSDPVAVCIQPVA